MMAKTTSIVVGVLVGAVVAYLAAVGIVALFGQFAAETNAIIIEQFKTNGSILKESAALEALHRRIAREGGLRGFLAGKILANGGLGYPEVNEPAARVWVLAVAAGAVIGAVAGVQRGWAIAAILVAMVWGVTAQQSPVALATILLGGAVGGAIALAALVGIDRIFVPAEG